MTWTTEENVTRLEDVASLPAKQRHTSVADLAQAIAASAYESGLSIDLIDRVVQVLVKRNHLDQTTITTLIKNLYPSARVTSKVVGRIICCLGPGKSRPSPVTQNLLLRWLILVYDRLEDRSYLSRAYGVLFDSLDMISLRRSLCHILSLITRRKHVQPFRIWALMELVRSTGGEEREVLGLLRVFKCYYPDIVLDDIPATRKKAFSFFNHPDKEWTQHMKTLLEIAATATEASGQEAFQVIHRGGVKRSRVEAVIPDVQTSRVLDGLTSLEEIRDVHSFVQRLDKIELPNQIASALAEPLAQRYLSLVKDREASRRMETWLASFFDDELDRINMGDNDGEEYLTFVLNALVSYVRFTKELPRAADDFLRAYLPVWNGVDNRKSILDLTEYLPLRDYEELRQKYFSLLENAILDNTMQSKSDLLQCYSAFIRQRGSIIRSHPSPASIPTYSDLIPHAELLSLTLLETQTDGQDMLQFSPHSVLQFYLQLAHHFAHAPLVEAIRITVPLPQTIYILLFTPVVCNISIMSGVLASYKSAFEKSINARTPNGANPLYPEELVSRFNGYVLDICNLLWRNRGLNSEEAVAHGCLAPKETVDLLTTVAQEVSDDMVERNRNGSKYRLRLPSMFSLSQNIALCAVSAACFRDIESRVGQPPLRLTWPVTQKALSELGTEGGVRMGWQEYRLEMLKWLDEHGSTGIGSLMRSAMMALRQG